MEDSIISYFIKNDTFKICLKLSSKKVKQRHVISQ